MSKIHIEVFINHPTLDEWDIVPLFRNCYHNVKVTELNLALNINFFIKKSIPKLIMEILSLSFFPCYKQYTIFEGKKLLCVKFRLPTLKIFLSKYSNITIQEDSKIIEYIKKLQRIKIPVACTSRYLTIIESFFKSGDNHYLVFSTEFLQYLQSFEDQKVSTKTIKSLNPLTIREITELGLSGLRF